jgi:hypothetical protein
VRRTYHEATSAKSRAPAAESEAMDPKIE